MRNVRGFSLIELLIVVVIIGVIAAIAVPNLLAARRSANEAATISALRTVHGGQMIYASTYGGGEYAGTPGALDGVGFTQLATENILDGSLASGTKSGYVYTSGTMAASSSARPSFCARAIPTVNTGPSMTGSRCFGVATDGVVMTNTAANTANCGCSFGAGGASVTLASALNN